MNMHIKSFLHTTLLLGLTLALLAACGQREEAPRPLITVSIEPLHYVADQLAGDAFDIATLTPDGASPETYQPTPQQVADLTRSSAYIRVGTLGFERTQLEKLTRNIPHLVYVNASKGIPALQAADASSSDSGDPHTWTSPREMKHIARNVSQALCALDTAAAPRIARRLQAFCTHMDSLERAVRRQLKDAPCRTFLIYHPALGYYARTFGLRQLSVEQDGKEASPRRVEQLIEECRREGVRVVFIQKEYNGQTARRIAEAIGARVVVINPLSYQWEEELLHITEELTR